MRNESMQTLSATVITPYGTQKISDTKEEQERDHEAILFGTALHYALEMLGRFDQESIGLAITALQNSYGQQLTTESICEIRRRIEALLQDTRFKQMLKGATVHKEQALSFDGEIKQIDLLLEYEGHCLVVDYKSSQKYASKHRKQVYRYQQAIAQIKKKPTYGAIIYLLKEKIIVENLK